MTFTLEKFERELRSILALRPAVGAADAPPGSAMPGVSVAFSGGLDSTVLLVAVARLAARDPEGWPGLCAVHVDHSLHPDSARWTRHCEAVASALRMPFESRRIDARPAAGASPEAAARDARYTALRAGLQPGGLLLTAHHADDQLETILLQWLRGGGLRAVAGMSPLARLEPDAWQARPLLAFTRAELEAWAKAEGLTWLEDPSNADRRFDRNYLRHEVLPALRTRWPAAAHTAARVAEFAREALAIEDEVAGADLAAVLHGRALVLEAWLALPGPRRRVVLRAWLDVLELPRPPVRVLVALERDMAAAADDRVPETRWPGVVVRRYRGHLHAGALSDDPVREGVWPLPGETPYAWTAGSALELVPDVGRGLSRESLPPRLTVARREGGESFVPAGGSHHRPLRKWLQERDVLPWRRADLPLLRDERGQLVAVADLGCGAQFAARPGEPSWRVAWHGRGEVTEPDAFGFKWPRHPPIG